MFVITPRQGEALRTLERTNGNKHAAARAMGTKVWNIDEKIYRMRKNTGLDPLHDADRSRLLEMLREQEEDTNKDKPAEKCKRPCVYRSSTPDLNGCDFLYLTRVRRGCPAGEGCTRFKEGPRMEDPAIPQE